MEFKLNENKTTWIHNFKIGDKIEGKFESVDFKGIIEKIAILDPNFIEFHIKLDNQIIIPGSIKEHPEIGQIKLNMIYPWISYGKMNKANFKIIN